MSERLTKRKDYGCACWNGDQNIVTHRRYMELLDALAKYEDVIFDADGNEIISLSRLRELAEDETKGRSTGFPDRNGTIIREHDIVRVTFLDRFSGKEYLREECEVIFAHGAFGFMWGNEKAFCTLCSFCVGAVVFYEIVGHTERALATSDDGEFMRNAMYDQLHSNGN